MLGGKNRQPLGYTIIEVMIVLAVSGVMFVIAASFIAGKQSSAAFTEGTNEFTSQLQSVIAEVINGQYSDLSFGCSVSGTSIAITAVTSGTSTQGLNPECVFVGKIIQFNYLADNTKYAVFSIAGDRKTGLDLFPPTDLKATPIISDDSKIDLTVRSSIPQNLQNSSVATPVAKPLNVVDASGPVSSVITGIGFLQSLGTEVANSYQSGAQTVNLVYTTSVITKNMVMTLHYATSAGICITDGTRYAVVQLGDSASNANQLSANLKVVTAC